MAQAGGAQQAGARRLRIAQPVFDAADREAVAEVVRSGWVSGYGPAVARFEEAFAAVAGVRFGVATTSGTTALHLALAALDLGPGDEVVIPAFTIVSVWDAVRLVGATPVLVDADRSSWNLDGDAVRRALSPRTRAIVAVHTYGLPCDMDALRALAAPRGVWLVEDAAEAHGATWRGRPCGSLGDLACFSFFSNKLITCGEGGMVVTSDASRAERLRRLRDLARRPGAGPYVHDGLGFNYRMGALAAALGLSQMRHLPRFLARRRRSARRYEAGLADIPGLALRAPVPGAEGSDWMTGVLVDAAAFGSDRDELARRLDARGIETRPCFHPLHRQPFATGEDGVLPVADDLGARGLLLPSGNDFEDADVERVIAAVRGEAAP